MAGEYGPISIVPVPSSIAPGGAVTFTVTLAGSPDANETVSISTNQSGCFTDLPPSVVVPAGSNHASFTAHASLTASGNPSVTASAAGTQVSTSVLIQPL